jgi:HSP20 family protein
MKKQIKEVFRMARPTLVQLNPIQDVLTFRDAMNQLFEDTFESHHTRRREEIVPPMDVSETNNSYIIELAVPGLKCDDLHVTVENNVLYVSGEICQEKQTEEQQYHRIERSFGKFQRSLTLPNTVKFDEIGASLNNGLLRLDIPKADEVKSRQITVRVSEN